MRNFQGIIFIWTRTYKEIFKSILVYLYWKVFSGNAIRLVTQNCLFRKSYCSQEILAPKKVFLLKKQLFGRTACFVKLNIMSNYLFSRSSSFEAVAALKKYLSCRSSWSERVFVTKKLLLKRTSCSRQLGILKSSFFKKVAALKI